MIIDTLDNIGFYFGLSKELDTALSVLKHYDLSLLSPGEYTDFPVDGCNTLLKLFEPEIVDSPDDIPWEYHQNMLDVQCVLKGGAETIGYVPRSKLSGWVYDESKDVAYTSDQCPYLPILLDEFDFAIFFPQDAHRKIHSTGKQGYRKLVLKVPINGFRLPNNK